jgi:hypothetical protein
MRQYSIALRGQRGGGPIALPCIALHAFLHGMDCGIFVAQLFVAQLCIDDRKVMKTLQDGETHQTVCDFAMAIC